MHEHKDAEPGNHEALNASPKYLHCAVRSTSEDGDSPSFASIAITQELIARVEEMLHLRAMHRLSDLAEWNDCADWGPEATAEDLRIRGGKLVAGEDRFWFSAYPKYGDLFETDGIELAHLREIAADTSGKLHWVLSEMGGRLDTSGLRDELIEAGRIPEEPTDDDIPPEAAEPRERPSL